MIENKDRDHKEKVKKQILERYAVSLYDSVESSEIKVDGVTTL
jgi:hypothetical protein